ncbi:MAG TPA: DUF488 family protein [Candidatus Paceibacterota bacterium]|nr:DUF488 family protein [Candidatus Paceibacterota bacterium]
MIKIKRIYDDPKKSDGFRVLVDRLWPRGISKDKAQVDFWFKEATPSNELRSWFHENKGRNWSGFEKAYREELQSNKKDLSEEVHRWKKNVTLLTAVKDLEHSHIPTLLKFLESLRKD